MKIRLAEVVFPCGRMDGRTDMTKLTVAFRNFIFAPKTHKFCVENRPHSQVKEQVQHQIT